jgi:hypothetical protein
MGACNSKDNKTVKRIPQDVKQPEPIINNAQKTDTVMVADGQNKTINLEVFLDGKVICKNNYEKSKKLSEVVLSLANYLPKNSELRVFMTESNREVDISAENETQLDALYKDAIKGVLMLRSIGSLVLPKNIKDEYYKTTIIGSLCFDESKASHILTYNKIDNTVNTMEAQIPKEFNYFSAVCNGSDHLFISGGDKLVEKGQDKDGDKMISQTVGINMFYSINLLSGKINQLKDLITPRFWHSMLYVPEQWIFIVGGANTKVVELYDIKNDTIKVHSELNETRGEASLCIIDNSYLYAFAGFYFQHKFSNTVERCNLRMDPPRWEYVNIYGWDKINISYFSLGYITEQGRESIILFGGNKTDDYGTSFNEKMFIIRNNSVEVFKEIGDFEHDLFPEKFFIPLDSERSALIPMSAGDTAKVIFLMDDGTVEFKKTDVSDNRDIMKPSTILAI